MIAENNPAPLFTLPNAEGASVSLADYRGSWVILYFYPKDNTPGCTTEACTFRDNFPFYEDTGLKVIGISRDSVAAHKTFKEKYQLPFELLSDTEGSIVAAYGAAGLVGTKRISYLIDPSGTVARAYPKVSPALHPSEVLADMKALSAQR